ncbi:MAG: 4-(cytidine 5'-diphospho)-2-C-methyl-D-erythritol kinase [Nitrospirota bacterium]|nr:4-(cytidine 5'-diphospho)-2-C-methyl-D-erythritol kinase [Nitrospirota bacterium]
MKNPQTQLVLHPPAKVNLILKVLGRLPNGYHSLWSIMQTVGLTDELEIRVSSNFRGVRLECPGSALPSDSNNLVYRAAEAVLERSRSTIGIELKLSKHIPMGAGLGGGSSDAAATVMGLNYLLRMGWSVAEMTAIGQLLGSDVPFFFQAPSALVRGCGEDLLPVTINGDRWMVLVNPGFPIATQRAYQELDMIRSQEPELSDVYKDFESRREFCWDDIVSIMANDFEDVLMDEFQALGDMRRQLMQAGAEVALLSGSGATVFGVFQSEQDAWRAKSMMDAVPDWQVWVVPTGMSPLLSPVSLGFVTP